MPNNNISSLDDVLRNDGTLAEVTRVALERVEAFQREQAGTEVAEHDQADAGAAGSSRCAELAQHDQVDAGTAPAPGRAAELAQHDQVDASAAAAAGCDTELAQHDQLGAVRRR